MQKASILLLKIHVVAIGDSGTWYFPMARPQVAGSRTSGSLEIPPLSSLISPAK